MVKRWVRTFVRPNSHRCLFFVCVLADQNGGVDGLLGFQRTLREAVGFSAFCAAFPHECAHLEVLRHWQEGVRYPVPQEHLHQGLDWWRRQWQWQRQREWEVRRMAMYGTIALNRELFKILV